MLSYNYTQPQFINEYNREIGYIISLVKEKCKNKGYIIKDEKNLFKNLQRSWSVVTMLSSWSSISAV